MSDRIEAEILDALGEEVDAVVDTPLVVIEGTKGEPGTPGKDGHTPVKGTDYWTAADKQEIVNSVIAALPDGTEVSY